jgi:hypothetical protein
MLIIETGLPDAENYARRPFTVLFSPSEIGQATACLHSVQRTPRAPVSAAHRGMG